MLFLPFAMVYVAGICITAKAIHDAQAGVEDESGFRLLPVEPPRD